MICPNCGNVMIVGTAIGSFYCKKCSKYIASTNARIMDLLEDTKAYSNLEEIVNYIENNPEGC